MPSRGWRGTSWRGKAGRGHLSGHLAGGTAASAAPAYACRPMERMPANMVSADWRLVEGPTPPAGGLQSRRCQGVAHAHLSGLSAPCVHRWCWRSLSCHSCRSSGRRRSSAENSGLARPAPLLLLKNGEEGSKATGGAAQAEPVVGPQSTQSAEPRISRARSGACPERQKNWPARPAIPGGGPAPSWQRPGGARPHFLLASPRQRSRPGSAPYLPVVSPGSAAPTLWEGILVCFWGSYGRRAQEGQCGGFPPPPSIPLPPRSEPILLLGTGIGVFSHGLPEQSPSRSAD